jgi:hypothetical protein
MMINVKLKKIISKKIVETRNAYKKYLKAKKKEKLMDEKPKIMAIDYFIYAVCKIWSLHIVFISMALILLLLEIVKIYFVQILALGVVIYGVYDHLQKKEPSIDYESRYNWLSEFIFQPLRDMVGYLPVRSPNILSDLRTPGKYIVKEGYDFYQYKLKKSTSEKIDESTIEFATKILESTINQKIDDFNFYNGSMQFYYKDIKTLQVDEIVDFGTHYVVTIIHIKSDLGYDYWMRKATPRPNTNINSDDEVL